MSTVGGAGNKEKMCEIKLKASEQKKDYISL